MCHRSHLSYRHSLLAGLKPSKSSPSQRTVHITTTAASGRQESSWTSTEDGAEEVPDSVKASMFSGKGGSNRWVLNPRSTVMRKWDLVIAALLFYTATVTPYDVAFLEPDINVLFFINRLVDLIFLIDLFFQFCALKP